MDLDVDSDSPFQSRTNASSPRSNLGSPMKNHTDNFEKLNRGDLGYGGNAFRVVGSPTTSPVAGLLTQRLRGLDVHYGDERDTER